jgi:hypothetical protein
MLIKGFRQTRFAHQRSNEFCLMPDCHVLIKRFFIRHCQQTIVADVIKPISQLKVHSSGDDAWNVADKRTLECRLQCFFRCPLFNLI